MRLIVLAAGQGTRLRPITDDRPKVLVPVEGRTLLEWQQRSAAAEGITDIRAVGGYCAGALKARLAHVVLNEAYERTNMVESLFRADTWFDEDVIISYGDIAWSPRVLRALLASDAPVSVIVDRDWRAYWSQRFDDVLADAESLRIDANGLIRSIGQKAASVDEIEAQYIGLLRFRGEGVTWLREAYAEARRGQAEGRNPFGGPRSLDRLFMTDLLQGLVDTGVPVTAVPVHGGWIEVDSPRDLEVASALVKAGRLD